MVEDEKETKKSKSPETGELVSTVKEEGHGLVMPDGTIVEQSEIDPGQAIINAYVVKTLDRISKNIA